MHEISLFLPKKNSELVHDYTFIAFIVSVVVIVLSIYKIFLKSNQ